MDFTPNLSPKEIIRLGSFGGIYFYDEQGKIDINFKEFHFKNQKIICKKW